MSIKTTSKTQLFFLEFLVVIVLLSLTAVVSVGLCAKAKEASDASGNLTYGVLLASTAAERFYAGYTLPRETRYDQSGEEDPEGDYLVRVRETRAESLITAKITVLKMDEEIYSLDVSQGVEGRETP